MLTKVGRRSAVRITQRLADSAEEGLLWDAQQTGFGLRVQATGRRCWVFRWRVGRRQHMVQLGVYRDTTQGEIVMRLADARIMARSWRAAVDQGRDPRSGLQARGETVADLWPAFLEHKRSREGLGERTLEGYRQHYATHLSHRTYGVASMPIRAVTRRDVIRLQRGVSDQGRRRVEQRYEAAVEAEKPEEYLAKLEAKLPTAGNGAANSVMLTLSSFLSWLVASGELDHNPCERIAKLPTAGRDPAGILDREDARHAMKLIREHARHDGHRDILLLLLLTAQRVSDIRLRVWEDLVLDDPEVPLPYLRVDRHKSRRRTRTAKLIPLGPEALAILLNRWPGSTLTTRRGEHGWEVFDELGTGEVWPLLPSSAWASRLPAASGPVFPGADPSKPLSDVWHPWRAIAKKAKRKRVRLSDVHGLRHAGASLMLAAGVPRELIQQALHHSAPETTQLYLHETADVYRRLGELLGDGITGRVTQ